MKPPYEIISAKPGQPSILWIGKSGRRYRKLVQAKTDKPADAFILPADKPEVTETKSGNINSQLFTGIVIVAIIIIIYKLFK